MTYPLCSRNDAASESPRWTRAVGDHLALKILAWGSILTDSTFQVVPRIILTGQ